MSDTQIKVDPSLLREYANRLKKVNSRLKALEGDLEALYRREGLVDIGAVLRSGDIGWSKTIDGAATYLLETAEDFENVEKEICDLLDRSMQGEHPFAYFDDGQQPWTIAGGLSQLEGNEEILSPMKNSRLITADELAALSPEEFVALLAAYSEPSKSSDKSLEEDANSPGLLSHQELVDELTSRKIASELPPYENTTNWREEGQLYGFLTAGAGIINQFIDAWNKGKRINDPFILSPIEVRKPAEPMLQNHKLELQAGQMAGKTLFEGVMAYATLGLGEAYAALRSAKSTSAITSAVDDGAANIAETARVADDWGLVDDLDIRGLGNGAIESKYLTHIESKVTATAKDNLPDWIGESFTDGNYRTVITNEKITLYRAFGGSADAGGGFATTASTASRIQAKIDAALLPEWGNTRMYEAVIDVPEGQLLNIGKVAEQYTKSGTKLVGQVDQILLPQNWPLEWLKEIRIIPSR